jgi:hypothetical protein
LMSEKKQNSVMLKYSECHFTVLRQNSFTFNFNNLHFPVHRERRIRPIVNTESGAS